MESERDIQELAEKHWEYTRDVLVAAGCTPDNLHHLLFVKALIHGYKHGEEGLNHE